jgi:hypothetical protein
VNGGQEARLFGGEAALCSSGGEVPLSVIGDEVAFPG